MRRIFSLLTLLIVLLLPSCILENTTPEEKPSEVEEFALDVSDPSEVLERTLNSDLNKYEDTYYYSSSPSGVITLTPNIKIKDGDVITYLIKSSNGEVYAPPFLSDENKTLARVNGTNLNLFLSNFDSLATYTVRAIYGSKVASYSFNINSSLDYPLSSAMSINYSSLKIKDDKTLSLVASDNKDTVVSLVADSSEITLPKGKVYSLFINDDITANPFGRLEWSIENDTAETDEGESHFVRPSVDTDLNIYTDKMTTSSNERNVFFFINNPVGVKSKITVKAGDKQEKSFYINTTDVREVAQDLSELFNVSTLPIVGGIRIICTLNDSSQYEKYYASLSINGAEDNRYDIYFDEEGVAYYDYTPSTIPDDELTIPVKVKIITSITSVDILESEDKEVNITLHKTPISATLETKAKDTSSPLIATNSLRPSLPTTTIGTWLSYTNDERVSLHITPINLTDSVDITLLDEAVFVIEKNNAVIYSRPYVVNGYVNASEVVYSILTTDDGGTYKAYVKDIKGYINTQSVAKRDVASIDINANVIFFPYSSVDETNSLFKVMVCDIALNPSDFMLYVQYSTNKGETWSEILSFDGSLVWSDNREDINKGSEITHNGSSIPFNANSENVLFRSLIVAKNENSYNVKRPTTGIKNENGEYVSTASLQTATPATVDNATQEYYNARQVTITRPSEDYDVYYYYERNNDGSLNNAIFPQNCTTLVPFGKIVEVTATGVHRQIGTTSKNKAVLLVGKTAIDNGLIALGKTAIITKTIDNSREELPPSYNYTRCDFEQCEKPNLRATHYSNFWIGHKGGTAHHRFHISNYTGFYTLLTFAGLVDWGSDKLHGYPREGQRWNETTIREKFHKFRKYGNDILFEDRTSRGDCYVVGYYSKKGYLDSEMTYSIGCNDDHEAYSVSWKRYPLAQYYKVIRQN